MPELLLLEDDPSLIEGLSYSLKQNGFAVDVARTVAQAMERLTDPSRYDLLLLDVTLPDGSGFAVCEAVRRRDAAIPILFLTASDEEVNIIRGLDAGGDDYLTKPFRLGELCSRIRALLRRSGVVFWLDRPVADIERTLERANRPLLAGGSSLETLRRQREALYRICADYAIREDTAQAAAEVIAAIWREQV